jgi:hypothetical protein
MNRTSYSFSSVHTSCLFFPTTWLFAQLHCVVFLIWIVCSFFNWSNQLLSSLFYFQTFTLFSNFIIWLCPWVFRPLVQLDTIVQLFFPKVNCWPSEKLRTLRKGAKGALEFFFFWNMHRSLVITGVTICRRGGKRDASCKLIASSMPSLLQVLAMIGNPFIYLSLFVALLTSASCLWKVGTCPDACFRLFFLIHPTSGLSLHVNRDSNKYLLSTSWLAVSTKCFGCAKLKF